MRNPRFLIAAPLALALVVLPAHAGVTVSYADPDRFTDAGDRNSDPRKIMAALERTLVGLGERLLPPHVDLAIEVLDLDRAGRLRRNMPTEIRVVSGKADMPCIDLRYRLVSDGMASQPVRERVCDPAFLRTLGPGYSANDPLVYEKRMLDEWFEERFAKRTPSR